MHANDIERVVVAEARLHSHRGVANHSGNSANNDRGNRTDVAGRRVIATRPATAPLAAPSTVGLPVFSHSAITHESVAAEAPRWVATKAETASPLAAKALPALKPNHPNHRRPAPVIVSVRLCGTIGSRG